MSTTIKSSRGLLIFGLFWTAFSSIFLIIGLKTGYDAFNRSNWSETPCQISSFKINSKPNTDPAFQVAVEYSYNWEGTQHTGNRLWADKKGEEDYEDLGELIEQYHHGKLKTCYVNPKEPTESVLIVGPGDLAGPIIFTLFGAGFVAIGIGMMIASRKEKKEKSAALSSKSSNNEAPKAIIIPFFSIFAIAGLGILLFVIAPQWTKYSDAKGWKETPAKVIWSRVKSHSDDDGTTYSVDIFYSYSFEGRDYKSNTVGLMSGSSSGRSSKQEKVKEHPPGKAITCYVNPEKPWQSLLERELGWWALFALFPLPFIAVGLGGLWWTFKKRSKAKATSNSDNKLGRRSSSIRHSATGSDKFHSSARKEFSPGGSRIKWVFGSIFIALFWNGITSVFVWQAVQSWIKGNGEWFLTIFITPFVLIGIGLILHIFYRLFALFNPSPKLSLTPGEITLGQSAKLKWNVSSGAQRINHFAIYLVGEEEAEYRRGTDTVKVSSIFYEQALIDTQDPRKSSTGSTKIELSPDAANIMPSWKSHNNRIKWSLQVKGKISFWPDVSDSYEVQVTPVDI